MGQTGKAPPCIGMLAASWNLHTKVVWSSPAREVIVKCSADKYLHVLLAGLINVQSLPLPSRPNYLLGTGESYGLTVQHMQDFLIFFIQLNYVHNKRNELLPPYAKLPCHKLAPRIPLPLSQFSHLAAFWYQLLLSIDTYPLFLISINYFVGLCWFVSIGVDLGIF